MISKDRSQPFGLLFEEPAARNALTLSPTYDEVIGLSYIRDQQGRQVAYAEAEGLVGTATYTRQEGEATDRDADPARQLDGTITITEAETEHTDRD